MRLRFLAAGLAAVLLLAAALEAFSLYAAYSDLRAGTEHARAAAHELGSDPAGWTADRVDRASAEADRGQALIDRARARLAADPLVAGGRVPPLAGDQVVAVTDLAGAAGAAATATRDAVAVARIYRDVSAGQGSPDRFLTALKEARPRLEDATGRLHTALDTLNRDRARPLLPPLANLLADAAVQLAGAAAQADSLLQATRFAPAALGDTAPRTYLVLLANPTELRPDGGFSGVVGTITFEHGSPTSIRLVDQYTLNGRYKQRFAIPLPIQQHLVEADNSLELGDAGWDPDLPSSAPLYEQMWQSATGGAVDGTMVVDPYAIQALLAITGPVSVAGYGAFSATDFLTRLNVLINATGADKATAVPAVAATVLKTILTQPGASYSKMASALLEQARERHLQLAVHDPALQAVVSSAGFSGAIRDAAGADYLMVVDANLGATKSDAYVQKTEELRVEKAASGLANHEVKLTYLFPALTSETDQRLNPKTHNNPGGDYRDYLRIYIPVESNVTGFQLLVDGRTSFTSAITENTVTHGKRAVGAYLDIGPGHRADVAITYVAPLEPGRGYRLLVQKQAGRPSFPTSLWLSYPGGQAKRSTDLVEDQVLEVSW